MSDADAPENPDLSAQKYEKHREAGEILARARAEAADRCEVGTGYLELSEHVEEYIRELGGEPAFPVNISTDEEAAHGAAAPDDDRTIGEEVVKLDVGVHVDGRLADTAVTVDLRGEPDLVEASEAALDAAIDVVEAGVDCGEVGAVIEETIESYDFRPVVNLSGHGLGHWDQHTEPNIPNRAVEQSATLSAGDVVAIEPFATTGTGKVREGAQEEIYALETERRVRDRGARKVLDQITEQFRTLPFARRWLDGRRAGMGLRRLKAQDVVHGYPVLKETEGELVSQKEHTVIVTGDDCEVTTA